MLAQIVASVIRQLLADPTNPTTASLFAAVVPELIDGSKPTPAELSHTLHNYIGYRRPTLTTPVRLNWDCSMPGFRSN